MCSFRVKTRLKLPHPTLSYSFAGIRYLWAVLFSQKGTLFNQSWRLSAYTTCANLAVVPISRSGIYQQQAEIGRLSGSGRSHWQLHADCSTLCGGVGLSPMACCSVTWPSLLPGVWELCPMGHGPNASLGKPLPVHHLDLAEPLFLL